jgi:hypothetical protein
MAMIGIASAALLASSVVPAADQGRADVTISGKVKAHFDNMEFMIDTGYLGKPIYRVTLIGVQSGTFAAHHVELVFPEHLRPGTYKVIGGFSHDSPAISDKPVPTNSDPAKVLIGVSYSCDCEHHAMMNTYAWGPAHGTFVVTSDNGKRISAHFKFTQQTPDGKDKVTVNGKLVKLDVGD